MAEKFSQFTSESTLANITGLAGYITGTPGTNVKISGNDIISSILPVSLALGSTDISGVLSANNGGVGSAGLTEGNVVVGEGTGNALSTIASKGKGTLIVGRTIGGAVDLTGSIPIGTDGHVLTANSAISEYGVEWAAPSGGSSPWTTSGNNIYFPDPVGTGDVGVGTSSPSARLTVEGTGTSSMTAAFKVNNSATTWLTASDDGQLVLFGGGSSLGKLVCSQIQIQTAPAAGKVLTSDATGNGTWQTPSGGMTVSTLNGSISPAVAGTVYLVQTGMTANAVVTLPAGVSGDTIGVKYISQALASNTCVVKTQTGKKIDSVVRDTTGLPLPSINTYYEFICDGTDWWIK